MAWTTPTSHSVDFIMLSHVTYTNVHNYDVIYIGIRIEGKRKKGKRKKGKRKKRKRKNGKLKCNRKKGKRKIGKLAFNGIIIQ